MFPVDARQAAALSDPVFMLKLYKRVAYGLVPRLDVGGPRYFLHAFLSVDGRCVASRDTPMEPRAIVTSVAPIFPSSVFSSSDVHLLLHVLPLEEEAVQAASLHGRVETGVRLGEVTLALRELIPFHAWQVSAIVDTVRGVVASSEVMSPFEEHVTDLLDYADSKRRQATEPPPPPLTTREALAFLERVGGLSSSQSHLLLKYVAPAEDNNSNHEDDSEEERGGRAGPSTPPLKVDLRLLHQLLFSEEIPTVAEYPLLMGRFAEAALDSGEPETHATGSLALLSSLRSIDLNYPDHARATPLDLDFGALVRAELTPRQFFYLCKTMKVGFQQQQSDQLFYYLKGDRHGSNDGVLVAELVAAFRQYFPPVTMSMLQLAHAATAALMRRHSPDGLVFARLYDALREWGTSRIPIEAFVKAFRSAGVPDGLGGVLDVELEWLRLKAPTRVDLLLMLTTPVPPSRTAVIQKLFERLDSAEEGVVPCATYLQRFQPSRIEGASLRRQVEPWKAALEAYVAELHADTLDYELFAYFWYLISAGVEDDPTFTVAVWQGFGLADGGRRVLRR